MNDGLPAKKKKKMMDYLDLLQSDVHEHVLTFCALHKKY